MQITLDQDEIHQAVESYVRSQINIARNQSIEIDFTAGRGPNGLSATLKISSAVNMAKPVYRETADGRTSPRGVSNVIASQEEPEYSTDPDSIPDAEGAGDDDGIDANPVDVNAEDEAEEPVKAS